MPLPLAGLGLRFGVSAATSALPSASGPRGFHINVETDIRAAVKQLKRVGERNVPLAVAQSLTATAKHLRNVQMRTMSKHIDRPTPFTKNGISYQRAEWKDYKRGTMYARVFVKEDQSKYLKYQVFGGTRAPKRRANTIPGRSVKLNPYGNFTKGYIKTQMAKPNTFVDTIEGITGLWQRYKTKPSRLLVMFTGATRYKPRWPFFRISDKIVQRELPKQLNKAVRRALKSRRWPGLEFEMVEYRVWLDTVDNRVRFEALGFESVEAAMAFADYLTAVAGEYNTEMVMH
jgi:hypothetical protein